MMKKNVCFVLLVIGFVACNRNAAPEQIHAGETTTAFEQYKSNFIESLWKFYPNWASELGYHRYDSILTVSNETTAARQLKFIDSHLDSLKSYSLNELSDNNKTDYFMIQNRLHLLKWRLQEEKTSEWNPSVYNVSAHFATLLNDNYDTLDTRLHHFYLKMKYIPAYYENAKQHIKNPTLEHTQLAIEQNKGGLSIFEAELEAALKRSHLAEAEKTEIQEQAKKSVTAINAYVDWLKKLDNKTPRSFRLGKELYAKKFELEIQSGYTVDQIYVKAMQHKKELHDKMFILANRLWSKYLGNASKPGDTLALIKEVINKVSLKHTTAEAFQTTIEKQIPELVDFIKKKELLTIDPSKPLVVRKEPSYMAGIAGASITAPGPYDKNGNTYYNVGTLVGWDKEKAESFLREYNYYTLQILNIHEAIPGHYTQLVYNNQSPSLIKSIFGNDAMVEGWAVYTELMMLENGYGNNEDEMWLMYYKWNLRATCNTILDYNVHTKGLNKEAALDLLIKEGFQEKTEAEGKWRRVVLTQVQLCCYFTGYTEIYDLREEMKKRKVDQFDLKNFHETFLSYGSAPVKYIKELMLNDTTASKP